MKDLFPEFEVRPHEAEAIARGLMVVARADGTLHERESALIAELYVGAAERAADLAALERGGAIEPEALAVLLPTRSLREVFLRTAILLAWVDSTYGPGEARAIGAFAHAMEVGEEELSSLETQVKEHMLAQLAHLQNTDAVVEVARELKV